MIVSNGYSKEEIDIRNRIRRYNDAMRDSKDDRDQSNQVYRLVLVRHGQSEFNKEKKFCGWSDIGLTELGKKQAQYAGKLLKDAKYDFDVCYTSKLQRTVQTFNHMAETMKGHHIPVVKDWRLNEKSHGALEGICRADMALEYGDEKVRSWRKDVNSRPPPLDISDPRHPINNARYKNVDPADLPATECLKDLGRRVIPYFVGDILPRLLKGEKVLITAHNNTIRAIMQYLDGLSDEQIAQVDIPNNLPLVYEFDKFGQKIRSYYLVEPSKFETMVEL